MWWGIHQGTHPRNKIPDSFSPRIKARGVPLGIVNYFNMELVFFGRKIIPLPRGRACSCPFDGTDSDEVKQYLTFGQTKKSGSIPVKKSSYSTHAEIFGCGG